jgi:dipeptidyl aminopeptidase/acylaminoacyl peptidase
VHGGPHNAWGPALDDWHLHHHTLAGAGWNVLTINSRGSDGYGEDFFRAVVGGWGTADEGDFIAAVETLVAEGVADPARLVVTGYSYGGVMSAWLSARTDVFAAAIPGGLACDMGSFVGTSDMGHHMERLEVGPDADATSALTFVDGVRAPTLILQGEADHRCPVEQAEQWFHALRARGVEVRMVRYPGASHVFPLAGRPSHRVDYSERVHAWAVEHT